MLLFVQHILNGLLIIILYYKCIETSVLETKNQTKFENKYKAL